jgi:hypothetical protein
MGHHGRPEGGGVSEIPGAVLSEHFQERMRGRRLVAAVFTTFRLEPAFFETEILPVFLDVPLSHVPELRLLQLEEVLRSMESHIAVYYDINGLVPEAGSCKLDVQRVPIRHATGVFHPKNVLALVEERAPDTDGHHARALLCACASANLTRAGWWENVEVAHVEEIAEASSTSLRDALLVYLDRLVAVTTRRRASEEVRRDQRAVHLVYGFLKGTTQRQHVSSDGRLHTQFHDGQSSLPDFLAVAGSRLRGLCLEVISPYFDSGARSAPLEALIDRFSPQEVRVFLPLDALGQAQCGEAFYTGVRELADVHWGALPSELLGLGKREDAKRRTVHAKVYRFFEPRKGGSQLLYVGSANLTNAGCGRGGNWETGFLVDVTERKTHPDWWLKAEAKRQKTFAPPLEADEEGAATGGTPLQLRFRWDTQEAWASWSEDRNPARRSPPLSVRHGGVPVLELSPLEPRIERLLDAESTEHLAQVLRSTSLLEVVATDGTDERGYLLVQEEGMAHKPSLLLELSVADILHYWSLLTPEQRADFLALRAEAKVADDPSSVLRAPLEAPPTMFDRFAWVFHAFGLLEERVRAAFEEKRPREAEYLLFGKKYDSFGSLLARVLEEARAGRGDPLEHYVTTLCARQMLHELKRDLDALSGEYSKEVTALRLQLASLDFLRAHVAATDEKMPDFLDWFEPWFLERSTPMDPPEEQR